MIDPIRMWRQRTRLIWLASAPLILVCSTWALWPLGVQPKFALSTEAVHDRIDTHIEQLIAAESAHMDNPASPADPGWTLDTFASVQLWNPKPQSVEEFATEDEQPKRPADPPAFELLGIVNENGTLMAALYDRKTDRVYLVASGDRIDRFEVTAIEQSGIELTDGEHRYRMAMASSIIHSEDVRDQVSGENSDG